MPVITINQLPGSFGEEISIRLSKKLGIPLIERSEFHQMYLKEISSDYDLKLLDDSPKNYLRLARNGKTFKENILQNIMEYTDNHDAVLVGTVPGLFLSKHPNSLNIRVTAPENIRKQRLLKVRGNTEDSVNLEIKQSSKMFKRFGKILFDEESKDPFMYHATINTGKVSVDGAVLMISELYRDQMAKEILFNSTAEDEKIRHRQESSTEMKNESEISFAKVLDMYNIQWVYEPKTFELERDENGNITSAFSPDFYLPTYDLYLELTIMNPKYAGEKKQKVRQIEKLYPGINIKLVQRKDFDHFIRSLNRANTVLTTANGRSSKDEQKSSK